MLIRADAHHLRTPRPEEGKGAHGSERAPYDSERSYVVVKWPHGSERAPPMQVKGPMKVKGPQR